MDNKHNNIGLIISLVIFIILTLGLCGYICYDKFFTSKEIEDVEQDNSKTDEKIVQEELLNIDSELVQTLYGYIKMTDLNEQSSIDDLIENKQEILLSDNPEMKNHFGFRQLEVIKLKTDLCRNYFETFKKNTRYFCGTESDIENSFNESSSTITFEESALKEKVELIFGEGSYERTNYISAGLIDGYTYDEATGLYVYGNFPGGGVAPTYTLNLVDVSKDDNYLILKENVTYDSYEDLKGTLDENILYKYKQDEAGNYYLYSIDIEK